MIQILLKPQNTASLRNFYKKKQYILTLIFLIISTAGCGIGIDRFVMLLVDVVNI